MKQKPPSPHITNISWGEVRIEKESGTFKDVKLFPGGAREWDWNETGTHHEPGIQIADVEELLDKGVEVIVLSKGFHERLQVCDETAEVLEQKGIRMEQLQTERAVEQYNELVRAGEKVGALIHSTC